MCVYFHRLGALIYIDDALQDVYWPNFGSNGRGKEPLLVPQKQSQPLRPQQQQPQLEITLQSLKAEPFGTERIMTVLNKVTNTSRVVIQVQVGADSLPAGSTTNNAINPDSLGQLASACLTYHRQQRVLTHPILVHCLEGAGKSAAFVLLSAAMAEINVAKGAPAVSAEEKPQYRLIPDVVKMGALLCQQRKGIMRERYHLKLAYEGISAHARATLAKRGVQVTPPGHSHSAKVTEAAVGSRSSSVGGGAAFEDLAVPGIGTTVKATEQVRSGINGDNKPAAASVSVEKEFLPPEILGRMTGLNLADPLGLAAEGGCAANQSSPNRKKITKQDFANSASSPVGSSMMKQRSENFDDPLSQLDPLWSLKSSSAK